MNVDLVLSDFQSRQLQRLASEIYIQGPTAPDCRETLKMLVRTLLPDGTESPHVRISDMSIDEALSCLLHATLHEKGTFLQLRMGNDPGKDAVRELRKALRVLWIHFREKESVPFAVAAAAASIMRFAREAIENTANQHARLHDEIFDLETGAFDLLSGPNAHTYPRAELDEAKD